MIRLGVLTEQGLKSLHAKISYIWGVGGEHVESLNELVNEKVKRSTYCRLSELMDLDSEKHFDQFSNISFYISVRDLYIVRKMGLNAMSKGFSF